MSEPLSVEDVGAIVHLLGELAGNDKPLAEKRRHFVQSIARLIDADIWAWSLVKFASNAMPILVWIIDGGWASDVQREIVMKTNFDPDGQEILAKMHVVEDAPSTHTRSQIISDDKWYSSDFYRKFRLAANLDDFMFIHYPLDDGMTSVMSYHRATGKPAFADRERCIAHVMATEIDWLHREGTHIPAPSNMDQLSPRLREVLLMLLAGNNRKEIAQKLHLSPHTIADYLKLIYRHFKVKSRGELLAKFIAGNSER